MAGVLKTLALSATAYVLCPAIILLMRVSPMTGACVVVALGVLAAVHVRGERRRGELHWQRLSRGQCPDCGYDIRVTPGRCPECGHGRAPTGNLSEV